MPAAEVLQEALGVGMLREGNLLHALGMRNSDEDLLLQGLPHGTGRADLHV